KTGSLERATMAHNETALVESKDFNVPPHRYGNDVESILISEEKLQARIQELADKVSKDYADTEDDLLLICVLKGAVTSSRTLRGRCLSLPKLSSWRFLPTETPPRLLASC